MPTVLRVSGFRVLILNPPREHGPAHVHVIKGDTEVIILLPVNERSALVREIRGMRMNDVTTAQRIVSENSSILIREWRRIHGNH